MSDALRSARARSSRLGLLLLASAAVGLAHLPARGVEHGERKPAVVDLHVDLSYQFRYERQPFAQGTGQYPATELRRAGVVGVVLPLYVPRDVAPEGPRQADLLGSYADVFEQIVRTPPYALPGCTPQARPVQTWLAFEGAAPLADDPVRVTEWIARGVRVFGLVHSYNNALAGSSGAPAPAPGLTAAGRRVVEQVLSAGATVDVSHMSDQATDDTIAIGLRLGRPVVATHSNARALAPHPRNLTDAQIRGIAQTGGVIGVNFHQSFLARRGRNARLADVVAHVRYLVRLAGIDHVAIGSDYEGDIRPVPELPDVSALPKLAEGLIAAGFTEAQIAQIFSRNALRVLCAPPP